MNLARAFAELEAGAELFCLHKNRVVADVARPAARLGRVRRGPRVRGRRSRRRSLGKPSPAFFGAALDALDADPS